MELFFHALAAIGGMNFNPEGNKIATIDQAGMLVLSEVNSSDELANFNAPIQEYYMICDIEFLFTMLKIYNCRG